MYFMGLKEYPFLLCPGLEIMYGRSNAPGTEGGSAPDTGVIQSLRPSDFATAFGRAEGVCDTAFCGPSEDGPFRFVVGMGDGWGA
jgi:hypothetical protein